MKTTLVGFGIGGVIMGAWLLLFTYGPKVETPPTAEQQMVVFYSNEVQCLQIEAVIDKANFIVMTNKMHTLEKEKREQETNFLAYVHESIESYHKLSSQFNDIMIDRAVMQVQLQMFTNRIIQVK